METGWWWGGRRRTFQLQRAAQPKAQYLGDRGLAWPQLRQALQEALSSAWTHQLPTPTPEEARRLNSLALWAASCTTGRRGSFPGPSGASKNRTQGLSWKLGWGD